MRKTLRTTASILAIILMAYISASAQQNVAHSALLPSQAQVLVARVLATELRALDDANGMQPMQYRLRKASPRLATTKLIVETRDGDVARLIAINDRPPSVDDQQREDARLLALINDSNAQRHRQQREQADSERVRKVIRALPNAFRYAYAGIIDTPQGPSYRFTFEPNPTFDPQDLEAQTLKAMAGELWIDVAQQRVTHLECKRLHDVDYGWGVLGKLDAGGTLLLEQADVGNYNWRTVRIVLIMNARVLLKTVKLDTTLELTQYAPVTSGLNYQQAIQILRKVSVPSGSNGQAGDFVERAQH